jgi:hypothetical protein
MPNLTSYLKAGQPCLTIDTVEVERAIRLSRIDCDNWTRCQWDANRGIINIDTEEFVTDATDPVSMMRWLSDQTDVVLFAVNLNLMFNQLDPIQELINAYGIWKGSRCCLVVVGTNVKYPAEIESFFMSLEFERPDVSELEKIAQDLIDGYKEQHGITIEMNHKAIESACGLAEFEAETAFALSITREKALNPDIIIECKKEMIKRSGFMEFYQPEELANVGGLGRLKKHLESRKIAFEPKNEHLPKPKAFLLVGIPGTGKSLVSKAASNIFGWPLVRFDASSCKGSLVGETEKNMRTATSTFDAFGRLVIWMDEIEKAFSGVKSSGVTDGGSTESMFGHFLTWIQESKTDFVIFATANSIDNLPPEFVRRFTRFFVDLPSDNEKSEIIEIMNRRYGSAIPANMAGKLKGWTGAEIEQLAIDSLFDGIPEAKENIVPISVTMKEQIDKIRDWAKTRARRANDTENPKTNVKKPKRRLS